VSATGDLIEAAFGDLEKVTALLGTGADPNAADAHGTTPLYVAAVQGHAEIATGSSRLEPIRILESRGETEGTPLCAAAANGFTETVRGLLANGADPNLAGQGDLTPLEWAAGHGHVEIARTLLDAGADPNLGSPLVGAAARGSIAVVRLLLERGAEPSRGALQRAEELSAKDIEADLREWAAKGAHEGEEIVVDREPRDEGTELVRVTVKRNGAASILERETGHAEIAELLRASAPR